MNPSCLEHISPTSDDIASWTLETFSKDGFSRFGTIANDSSLESLALRNMLRPLEKGFFANDYCGWLAVSIFDEVGFPQ
jgi:hypothetical protein